MNYTGCCHYFRTLATLLSKVQQLQGAKYKNARASEEYVRLFCLHKAALYTLRHMHSPQHAEPLLILAISVLPSTTTTGI